MESDSIFIDGEIFVKKKSITKGDEYVIAISASDVAYAGFVEDFRPQEHYIKLADARKLVSKVPETLHEIAIGYSATICECEAYPLVDSVVLMYPSEIIECNSDAFEVIWSLSNAAKR